MKELGKTAAAVVVLLIISKILGLIREIALAEQYGASYIVDAYTIAISLPSVIFSVFASGFSNSYIPAYSHVNDDRKDSFFNITITILTIASLAISLLCFLFAEPIVQVMAPGFIGEANTLTVEFIKIISFIFPFMTIFSILCCQSQVKERFIFIYFCDYIVVNLVVILSIYISSFWDKRILAYGYVSSMVIASLLLIVYAKKNLINSYHFCVNVKNNDFLSLVKLAIPLGLSLVVNQLNSVVDKMFSSSMGEGITSALSYANRIQLIPYSLAVSVVLSVYYPRISHCFALEKRTEGIKYLKQSSLFALFIGIPVVGLLFFFAEPIVRLLFERGAFNPTSTSITSRCLMCYSFGIPFYSIREVSSKALAANMQQESILKNTIITFLANIILDVMFVRVGGYMGLAFATSFSGFISFVLMNMALSKHGIRLWDKQMGIEILKIVFDTAVCIILGLFVFNSLLVKMNSNLAIIITLLLAGVIYITVGVLFRISFIKYFLSRIGVGAK